MKISDIDIHPKVIYNIVYALIASVACSALMLIYLYIAFTYVE